METWEEARINRLEKRIEQLELKNWERSATTFRLVMYVYTAVFVALCVAAIVLSASHPGH